MYEASLLRSFNIYIVENLSHSIISLVIVIAALSIFGIRQPASRIKFLLIPVILPALAAPLYYLLSPDRFGLPVIDVDDWINIEAIIERSGHSVHASYAFTFVILTIVSFLLFKGIMSLAAVVWLPRRYPCVSPDKSPQMYSILDRVLKVARTKRPLVLLYPGRDILCCAFGFRQPYLLVSKGALESLSEDDLEAVVAHEIGHIQRWDSWLGFIVLTFRNIFFFNPVVLLLCSPILKNAELAADELALSFGPNRLSYVESLVRISRIWSGFSVKNSSVTCHFIRGRAALKSRVLYALEENPMVTYPKTNWIFSCTLVILIIGLFFIC